MSDPSSRQAKSDAEQAMTGRLLGDFRLIRRLGRGAMAEIYLAEQLSLKRRVAVKILKPELANDPTYLQRFEIEAQAAASLVHANIVQIYEVGHVDSRHYIAQEYVQGQNLRDWLARNGPPDLAHALSVMRQVASALAKAAEVGVVHRDIKPENIMITTLGEVKVADFGLARLTREGAANGLTQIGITLGTPLYMSPEQVEGKPLAHRSDIYSFGVTSYQMLAGTPPFSGDTALAVAVQHLKTQPKPLETLRTDLPPALCRLVHTMLVKDPERRCQSARDILRELRRIQIEVFGQDWPEELPGWESLAGEATLVSRSAVTQQFDRLMKTQTMRQRPKRRYRWGLLALAGTFLLGLVLARFAVIEPYLLADAKSNPPDFKRYPTVAQQWYYASKYGTESAWKSIEKYYAENGYYVDRANQQLAILYLKEGNYEEAMDIFEKFTYRGESDRELRAFGLAGQSVVYSYKGEYDKSNKIIDQFLPQFIENLNSPQMDRYLQEAIKRNLSKPDAAAEKQ